MEKGRLDVSNSNNISDIAALEIKNLKLKYRDKKKDFFYALNDVSFLIKDKEIFGLVGESGCGKTSVSRVIMGLENDYGGKIIVFAKESGSQSDDLLSRRKQIQMVFQDPYTSLDPSMNIKEIIEEPMKYLMKTMSKRERENRAKELLSWIGLDSSYLCKMTEELSGGQRQRVCIARAISCYPKILICDEAVSALDVSVQSQILNLLKRLNRESGLTIMFISHDLGVIRHLVDRVCVMLKGRVCEIGNTDDIFSNPLHPYTKSLIDAIPKIRKDSLRYFDDSQEINFEYAESGCPFFERCVLKTDICMKEYPDMKIFSGRVVYCHNVLRY